MSVCVDIKKSMHVDILVIDIYVDIFYLPKTFLSRQIFLKSPLGRDVRPRKIFCDGDVLCCRVLAVTGGVGGVSMVSRRKILSRSRDDLNLDTEDYKEHAAHHQDDTWYSKEKLYKVLH